MAALDHAKLSSLATTIEDLAARLAALAEELDDGATSDSANALFEAERSLHVAGRAVARARRTLPG